MVGPTRTGPPMSNLIPELLHVVGAIALRPHGMSPLHNSQLEARALWFAALLIVLDLIGEGVSRGRYFARSFSSRPTRFTNATNRGSERMGSKKFSDSDSLEKNESRSVAARSSSVNARSRSPSPM